MPITENQIKKAKAPFCVVGDCLRGPRKGLPRKERPSKVIGFSGNDPLNVGGGIFPNNPSVYFEGGGWGLLTDVMQHYTIVSDI